MDKAGPSGDYDASNTSIRESKPSTMLIEEMYDVNENCLNRLNGIRRGLNLSEFKEYRDCLPSAFIDPRINKTCTISITERSGFTSEQTSPNSTFRHGIVNNNFRSATSFNLIPDFQLNSQCSRPDTATTENSSINNHDHYFICAHNNDFTNPISNCYQSKSTIDPFTLPELHLDLTESSRTSNYSPTPSPSPVRKKAHLSSDDIQIEYELSSCELRKIGPVNNWSTTVGQTNPPDQLSARCLEVPPKRMRFRLNTPRFSITQSSPIDVVQNCYTKFSSRREDIARNTERVRVHEIEDSPNGGQEKNHKFRGCLSAVDGQCETLADLKPRSCRSNQINNQDFLPIKFKDSILESTEYSKTSTAESFSQICKKIQQDCIHLDEEYKKSLTNNSSTDVSNLNSEEEMTVREPRLDNRTSDTSSSSSRSTTSYEIYKASISNSLAPKIVSDKGIGYISKNKTSSDVREFSGYHKDAISLVKESASFNISHVPEFEHLDPSLLNDHYSISRPSTGSHTGARDHDLFKINIPSSIEDDEFVNVSCLEPNITTIDSGKHDHRHESRFRFWRFKRRKDRLGSGDTSGNSGVSKSDCSVSSRSYIVSPVGVSVDPNINMRMITNCEKPDKKRKHSNLDNRAKSKGSIDFEETELGLINYSDFCLPIKSLDKLPDEKSVKDILQTMSQSIFKKCSDTEQSIEVNTIGDCKDLKEDLILRQFSNYSQFKTRAELLAEHLRETAKEEEEEELEVDETVSHNTLSKVIKEASYTMKPSASEDSSDTGYYLNHRKPQNTQIRFYEIPSPMNSCSNLNQRDESLSECKHERESSEDTVVKIDDEDDDMATGFCANCFCKRMLFPKMRRSYFL